MSVLGVILFRIFPHSGWIRRDTQYSVRMQENADHTDTFYAVISVEKHCFVLLNVKLKVKVSFKTSYRLLELLYTAFTLNAINSLFCSKLLRKSVWKNCVFSKWIRKCNYSLLRIKIDQFLQFFDKNIALVNRLIK